MKKRRALIVATEPTWNCVENAVLKRIVMGSHSYFHVENHTSHNIDKSEHKIYSNFSEHIDETGKTLKALHSF